MVFNIYSKKRMKKSYSKVNRLEMRLLEADVSKSKPTALSEEWQRISRQAIKRRLKDRSCQCAL
jgi:hypothetical protein